MGFWDDAYVDEAFDIPGDYGTDYTWDTPSEDWSYTPPPEPHYIIPEYTPPVETVTPIPYVAPYVFKPQPIIPDPIKNPLLEDKEMPTFTPWGGIQPSTTNGAAGLGGLLSNPLILMLMFSGKGGMNSNMLLMMMLMGGLGGSGGGLGLTGGSMLPVGSSGGIPAQSVMLWGMLPKMGNMMSMLLGGSLGMMLDTQKKPKYTRRRRSYRRSYRRRY